MSLEPAIVALRDGTPLVEYLVLVHLDSDIGRPDCGAGMLVGLEIKGPAPLWLDVELMREGLPPALKLFRTDRLSPFQPSHLENVLNLVATHNELSSGPNSNEP